MKNRRALFSAITSLTMLAVAVIAACSSDDKSTFPPGDKPNSAVGDTGPGFFTDAKGNEEKDANVTCKPALPTTFKPTFKAVDHQDACDFQQLTDYYAHCLANDENGGAKIKSTECSDWRSAAANSVCSHCIETEDNSGPVQVYNERLYYTLNSAGCIAIKQKAGAVGSCAEKYDTAASCRREACKTCLEQEGAQFQDFIDCEAATIAARGDCLDYQNTSVEVCGTSGYKDAGSSNSAVDCFGKDKTESQGDVFVRVEKVFCGKP